MPPAARAFANLIALLDHLRDEAAAEMSNPGDAWNEIRLRRRTATHSVVAEFQALTREIRPWITWPAEAELLDEAERLAESLATWKPDGIGGPEREISERKFDCLSQQIPGVKKRLLDCRANVQAATPRPAARVDTQRAAIDPTIQRILELARAKDAQIMEGWRACQEKEARLRRAEAAWRCVASFKGDSIPRELTGDALWRRYAQLIVELGDVLRDDGWQADVDAITPGSPAKQIAVETLRQAMIGNVDNVTTLVKAMKDSIFTVGLHADTWLREGLMNEVLHFDPPAHVVKPWHRRAKTAGELAAELEKYGRAIGGSVVDMQRTPADGVRDALDAAKIACEQSQTARVAVDYAAIIDGLLGLWREWIGSPPKVTRPSTKAEALDVLDYLKQELHRRFPNGEAAKSETPPTTPAGHAESTPDPPATPTINEREPLTGAERDKAFQLLEPAEQKAYLSFEYAQSKQRCRLEDREAHKLLDDEGIPADQGHQGRLIDYELPEFDTWSRQLREARRALGEQKYKRRGRPRTGKSIVKGNQIEDQKGYGK